MFICSNEICVVRYYGAHLLYLFGWLVAKHNINIIGIFKNLHKQLICRRHYNIGNETDLLFAILKQFILDI